MFLWVGSSYNFIGFFALFQFSIHFYLSLDISSIFMWLFFIAFFYKISFNSPHFATASRFKSKSTRKCVMINQRKRGKETMSRPIFFSGTPNQIWLVWIFPTVHQSSFLAFQKSLFLLEKMQRIFRCQIQIINAKNWHRQKKALLKFIALVKTKSARDNQKKNQFQFETRPLSMH